MEVNLSECMVMLTNTPMSESSNVESDWANGLYLSASQAYSAYYKVLPNDSGNSYVNLIFEGLREWWLQHKDESLIDDGPALEAANRWGPIDWISVDSRTLPATQQAWNWYWFKGNLTPYDILSIPLDVFLSALQKVEPISVRLWKTRLTVIVYPRLADKYHPGLQILLD